MVHSAVFRNFFKGGKIKVSRNKGGKPSWMQNVQSDLVFQGGANALLCPPLNAPLVQLLMYESNLFKCHSSSWYHQSYSVLNLHIKSNATGAGE